MRGLMTQLQVMHGLLLREMKTRFGEHHWGYAWALIGPAMWVGTFIVLYFLLGRLAPPGMSVVAFLVTGIITFQLFRETSTQSLHAISGNKGLLFYPQVRPLDLVVARALLEGATHLVVFALLMSGAALFEGKLRIAGALTTLMGLGLALGLGVGFGLVLCGLSTFSSTVERLHGPLMRPLFWLSAVFYPVEFVPTTFQNLLLWNPVVHAIELVRTGWFPGYHSRHINPWYPAAWILVLLFFGLSLERVARRRLQLS
jgi:capsular polysaccharide transport system permease protein